MKKIRGRNLKLVLSTIFLITFLALICLNLYFSFSNGTSSTGQSNFIGDLVGKILSFIGIKVDIADPTYKMLIRKIIGHFGLFLFSSLFGVLSIICYKPNIKRKSYALIITFLIGVALGIFTEVIQMFQEGRGPAIEDTLIDILGYTIPVVIYGIYLIIKYEHEKKNGRLVEI